MTRRSCLCLECGKEIDEAQDFWNKGLCDTCSDKKIDKDIRENGLDW